MTDEEMAEEYALKLTERDYIAKPKEIVAYLAFLAGLKAGRPQWHKVADGDLPKDEKDMLMSEQLILLTRMKGTDNLSISIGQYNFSMQEFSYPHLVGITDVIAWCEIPTFDKENDIKSEMFPEITLPEGSAEIVDKAIADAEKHLKEIE